jgi:DNA primase
MSNYFPQEFIEQVRSATDIVAVISEYVSLKKKGRNYFGLCPFHAEKTPSFSVNAEKQIFHCFGCGQGGNAVTFLISHDKLGFVEAIKLLAKRANLRLPQKEYDRKSLELTDKLYFANQMTASYFTGNFSRTQAGKEAWAYLEKRKISSETIKTFQLGLALEEWDGLLKFCTAKGVENQTLLVDGLIIERSDGKGYYDRFKSRLMFPIFNLSGRIVAFAGRILNENDSPKYLNSPETPIYQKGKLLYGLNFSKEEIRKKRIAIIVEGYMDFLSLYQNGIQNLVASCGTAFTPDQARLLSRFSEEAILLFDSDSAGQRAVLRSVDLLYDAGLEVKVAVLPQAYDPDLYVKEFGPEKLNQLLSDSVSYVKFKIGLLKEKFGNLSLPEQEQIILDFAQTASKISDGVRRELFLKQVSDQLSVSEQLIRRAQQKVTGKIKEKPAESLNILQKPGPEVWEREFLGFLLNQTERLGQASKQIRPEDFSSPLHRQVWETIAKEVLKKKEFDLGEILEQVPDSEMRRLLLEVASLDLISAEPENTFQDYLLRFKSRKKEKEMVELKKSLKKAEQEKDYDAVKEISIKLQNILKGNQLAPN